MAKEVTKYWSPKANRAVTSSELRRLGKNAQEEVMRHWFGQNFMDPNELPYETREGGFQWIWGHPSDPRDALENEFS